MISLIDAIIDRDDDDDVPNQSDNEEMDQDPINELELRKQQEHLEVKLVK